MDESTARPSRILFIRDLPKDLDQDTVDTIFNKQPGFITMRRLPNFTFVEFRDIETSTQALQNLQGYTFRSYDKPLHVEYDKATREDTRKRKIESDRDKSYGTDDRDSKRRDRAYPPARDDYRRGDYRPNDFFFNSGYGPFPPMGGYPPGPGVPPAPGLPTDCSTLYVTSLPKDITERELSILFRFMPGFSRVRLIVRDTKSPFCFADFLDPSSASYAIQNLQGFRVDLKEPYGLHIEFDRNHRPYPPPSKKI